jgi:PAS domain S-box-containing protein
LSVVGPTSLPLGEHLHTVQFYDDDAVLFHELKEYVGSALAKGSSALIIATQGHLENLAHTLNHSGVSVGEVTKEGRYLALPAAEVMSKFMVQGVPEPTLFSQVTGELISRAAQASRSPDRRVVAFGEMVALLWAEGHAQAALELEKLWNKLSNTYSFSLHCAYPMQGFCREELADSMLKICAEHTGTLREGSSPTVLPCASLSPQEAQVLTNVKWHKREEPFKLFVESVQEYAIFMLDRQGCISTWNAGAQRAKGYVSSEIIGQHFSVFYPEEDVRSGKPQYLLDCAARDGHVEDEGWRVRKDGSRFWARVTITAVKDESGTLVGFGKVTRDLTEKMRSEQALRRSEERSRLFIQAVQDYAIFMLDPEGCVSTWNTGAERIKGYTASEIIG